MLDGTAFVFSVCKDKQEKVPKNRHKTLIISIVNNDDRIFDYKSAEKLQIISACKNHHKNFTHSINLRTVLKNFNLMKHNWIKNIVTNSKEVLEKYLDYYIDINYFIVACCSIEETENTNEIVRSIHIGISTKTDEQAKSTDKSKMDKLIKQSEKQLRDKSS